MAFAAALSPQPAAAQTKGGQERPSLTDEQTIGTNRFLIHYTLSGDDENRVEPTDSNGDGTPDFVEEVASTLEVTLSRELDDLGWAAPPNDIGEGGDTRFDVYLVNVMPDSIAGYANFGDGFIGDNPATPEQERHAAYAYLVLDNDYAELLNIPDFPETPIQYMQVTVAHEIHHAIQFGYDASDPQRWLYESTSTWMEDEVYPDVNDNWSYLPEVFADPDICRTARGELRWYGSWLFLRWLSEKYGDDIVRSIWENTRASDGYSAIDNALIARGSTLYTESRNFAAANLLRSYQEGSNYPTVRLEGSIEQGVFRPDDGVQSLGADTIELTGSGVVDVSIDQGGSLSARVVGVRGGEADIIEMEGGAATIDLSAYQAAFVVIHDDELAADEDECEYRDYTLNVAASSTGASAPDFVLSAANYETPTGAGGIVTNSSGVSTFHPLTSGGAEDAASAPEQLDVPFGFVVPETPPFGYGFDYAYVLTADDFGSSADYYVPGGGLSANLDYLNLNLNWLSISQSESPYQTLDEWVDDVNYDTSQGSFQTISGVEVLVEDLSSGDQASFSATFILQGLFIVVDGDSTEQEVVDMVQAVINTTNLSAGQVTAAAPTAAPAAQTDIVAIVFGSTALCVTGITVIVVGVAAMGYLFYRRRRLNQL